MLRLYDHPLSPYAQKVKIALREKGVAFETVLPGGLGAGGAGEGVGALGGGAGVLGGVAACDGRDELLAAVVDDGRWDCSGRTTAETNVEAERGRCHAGRRADSARIVDKGAG